MNILLLNVNIGKAWGWGGIESHSDMLASLLSKRGHRVIMGCWKEGSVEMAGGTSLPSRRITIRNSGDIAAIAKIRKICLSEDIRVVLANGGREYWPAAVAGKAAGRKVIFIRHQVDRLKKTTVWLINNYVDRVIAVSGAVKNALEESGVAPEKIGIIYNAIVLDRFASAAAYREDARKEFGIAGNDIVIGTAGKLNFGKGVFDLVQALAALTQKNPAIRLLFVGEGPDRPGLEQEARQRGVYDKVIFAGLRKDMERMYAAMDIFTLPSTCEEAFGMVLIEAMAMGKPVVATRVGGIPEIVEDGVNGLLVPPGDVPALARALSRYIDDRHFCERAGAEGSRVVETKFSARVMGDNFERMLLEVTGETLFPAGGL